MEKQNQRITKIDSESGLDQSQTCVESQTFQTSAYCYCPYCGGNLQTSPNDLIEQKTVDNGWLNVDQVAGYLQLTPKAVREGAAKGTLLGHKYPEGSRRGRWLFKKAEIDKKLMKPPRHRRSQQTSINVWE